MVGWSSLNLSKSQCACSCPSSPNVPGHTGRAQLEKPSLATPDAQRAEGTYDTVDSLMYQGQWEALSHRPLSFGSIPGRKWQDIVPDFCRTTVKSPPLVGAAAKG